MSKLTAVILTAAICLPLGALLQGNAAAERRKNGLPGEVAVRHRYVVSGGVGGVIEHRQLSRARSALHEALDAIEASRYDGEAVWSDTSRRATATREAIERAVQTIEQTAAWVNNGIITNRFPAP